jgi:acyl-CoA synthetase (AMP-forming)/AMP-acid ligase II
MIILKGQNIYPSDIEEVLATHPKIAEARVIGIPDRLRGEIVAVVIRLREKVAARTQEIKHFCQEHMADYRLPRRIIFTGYLSKISNTKVGKKKLRDYLSNLPHLSPPLYKHK